jgi:heme a synthase
MLRRYLTKPDVYSSTRVARGWAMGVHGLLSLIFVTVLAGAFVAGLDAGLVYPSFPKMGDHWIPPEYSELSPWYRNIFENPVATQFNHRVLGMTTAVSVLAFSFASLTTKFGRRAGMARNLLAGMVIVQASLGIGTLLYHVPVSMAAAHQSGSLVLLSFALWLAFNLKRVPKI